MKTIKLLISLCAMTIINMSFAQTVQIERLYLNAQNSSNNTFTLPFLKTSAGANGETYKNPSFVNRFYTNQYISYFVEDGLPNSDVLKYSSDISPKITTGLRGGKYDLYSGYVAGKSGYKYVVAQSRWKWSTNFNFYNSCQKVYDFNLTYGDQHPAQTRMSINDGCDNDDFYNYNTTSVLNNADFKILPTGIDVTSYNSLKTNASQYIVKEVYVSNPKWKTIPVICKNAASFDLSTYINDYQYMASVTVNGTAVINGQFNPSLANLGDNLVSFSAIFDEKVGGKVQQKFDVIIKVVASYNEQASTLGDMYFDKKELSFCSDNASIDLRNLVRYYNTGTDFTWEGGNGLSFDPKIYTNAKNLTYSYTNGNGCVTTHVLPIKISPTFSVTVDKAINQVCKDAVLNLSATPIGGIWSSDVSITGNQFKGSISSVGAHKAKYTVVKGSCTKSDSVTVNVFGLPPVTTGGKVLEFCKNSTSIQSIKRSNTYPQTGGTWNFISNPALDVKLNQANSTFDISSLTNDTYVVRYTFQDANKCTASDTMNIIINDVLNPPITQQTFRCEPGSLLLQIQSPQSGVEYKWYDDTTKAATFIGTSYQTPVVNSTTKYFVNSKNAFNCSSKYNTVFAEVRSSTPPTTGATQFICFNSDSVKVTGATPVGGVYTGANLVQVGNDYYFKPKGLSAGGYQLTYTATINGCPSSANKQIQIRQPINIDAGLDKTICFGDTAAELNDLNVFPSGGSWEFNNPNFNKLINGTKINASVLEPSDVGYLLIYKATDLNTGCSSIDTKTLSVRALPSNPIVATDVHCGKSFGQLIVSNFDGNSNLKWYNDPLKNVTLQNSKFDRYNTPSIIENTTSYFVEAINTTGCKSNLIEAKVLINPLPIVTIENAIICLNESTYELTKLVEPTSGLFYKGNSLVSTTILPKVLGVGAYQYDYEVTNTFGCKTKKPILIEVVASKAGYLLPNDTSFCKSIAPLNLANWSKLTKGTFSGPGVENGILVLTDVVDPDNIITISYSENNNGCLFQDQVDITMLSSPNKPTIDGLVEGCDNATLNLFTSKGNNLTYKWFGDNAGTPFSTDQNVNVIVGNVNVVELETINAIGCPSIGRAIVNVVSNNPSVSFTKSKTNLVSGDLITYNYTGSTAQTIFWEFTNGTSATGINPKQFAFSDTIKKVGLKLTATNKGCSSIVSADTAYIVTPKPITVLTKGDANTFSGNNASSYISIYPNPVLNVVHFDLVNEEGEHQLTIYDVLGNQIVSSQLSGKNSIDVSHLNSGSYIATISGSSFNQTFKIIK